VKADSDILPHPVQINTIGDSLQKTAAEMKKELSVLWTIPMNR
jgi:hypothetical protein